MASGNQTCWARVLGDCHGAITGEHIYAKTLFDSKTVTVQGAPWCQGASRTVGLANLTANILCKKHNNGLSGLDSATKKILNTFTDVQTLRSGRERGGAFSFTFEHPIDGEVLERSLLRVAINVVCAYTPSRQWALAPGEHPPERLVRYVFGDSVPKPLGLYVIGEIGQNWNIAARGEYKFIDFLDGEGDELVAAGLFFHGYRFVWWLVDRPAPVFVPGLTEDGLSGRRSAFLRHPTAINIDIRNARSQIVRFDWDKSL